MESLANICLDVLDENSLALDPPDAGGRSFGELAKPSFMEMIADELGRCLEQLQGDAPVIYEGEGVRHRPA